MKNFLAANNLFHEAGVKILYYGESDLWNAENAKSAGPSG
jgi:hypothetical protein